MDHQDECLHRRRLRSAQTELRHVPSGRRIRRRTAYQRQWTSALNNNNDNISSWSRNVNSQHFHWTITRHSQQMSNVTRSMKQTNTAMVGQQVSLFLGWSLASSFRASLTRRRARDDIRTICRIVPRFDDVEYFNLARCDTIDDLRVFTDDRSCITYAAVNCLREWLAPYWNKRSLWCTQTNECRDC